MSTQRHSDESKDASNAAFNSVSMLSRMVNWFDSNQRLISAYNFFRTLPFNTGCWNFFMVVFFYGVIGRQADGSSVCAFVFRFDEKVWDGWKRLLFFQVYLSRPFLN